MHVLEVVHSLLPWLILASAVVALVGARTASAQGSTWPVRAGQVYATVLDVQVLIGLILWAVKSAWRWRPFFAVIHPVAMVLAALVAHYGGMRQKRGKPAAGFWPYLVSLALVAVAVPWWWR